jgi:hypothetical protein
MSDGFATRAATTRRMTGSIATTSSAEDAFAESSTMSSPPPMPVAGMRTYPAWIVQSPEMPVMRTKKRRT